MRANFCLSSDEIALRLHNEMSCIAFGSNRLCFLFKASTHRPLELLTRELLVQPSVMFPTVMRFFSKLLQWGLLS